jgi:hypothetical protein
MGRQAARLVLVSVFVGSVACAAAAPAGASRGVLDAPGPRINITLTGGIARDLSIDELRAVNRARAITFPR